MASLAGRASSQPKQSFSANDVIAPNLDNEPSRQQLLVGKNAIKSTSSTTGAIPLSPTPNSRCLSESTMLICRICHESESQEELVSLCKCAGTMGLLHRSCVEKWLSSINSNHCEICNFKYITTKKKRPFREWLVRPSRRSDKRNLLGDLICFLLLTPLAGVSGWLCITGAMHYSELGETRWEAIGLISLSVFLAVIYSLWCGVAIKYHLRVFQDWRKNNPIITIVPHDEVIEPYHADENNNVTDPLDAYVDIDTAAGYVDLPLAASSPLREALPPNVQHSLDNESNASSGSQVYASLFTNTKRRLSTTLGSSLSSLRSACSRKRVASKRPSLEESSVMFPPDIPGAIPYPSMGRSRDDYDHTQSLVSSRRQSDAQVERVFNSSTRMPTRLTRTSFHVPVSPNLSLPVPYPCARCGGNEPSHHENHRKEAMSSRTSPMILDPDIKDVASESNLPRIFRETAL